MKKKRVLISVPHGGSGVPDELKTRVRITKEDLFDDIDPFTLEIYNAADDVFEVVSTDIARTFVDLNRAPDDRPPANPDGVVKSSTCHLKPIYEEGREPDDSLVESLLARYHVPYHDRLRRAARGGDVLIALDCHSMAAEGPPRSPDAGKRRPVICLGNVHGKTCSEAWMEQLSGCFHRVFGLRSEDVTFNRPFAGGYITRTHGTGPVPWVQIEMSRALYLETPWFDRTRLTVDNRRLLELREKFVEVISRFIKSL